MRRLVDEKRIERLKRVIDEMGSDSPLCKELKAELTAMIDSFDLDKSSLPTFVEQLISRITTKMIGLTKGLLVADQDLGRRALEDKAVLEQCLQQVSQVVTASAQELTASAPERFYLDLESGKVTAHIARCQSEGELSSAENKTAEVLRDNAHCLPTGLMDNPRVIRLLCHLSVEFFDDALAWRANNSAATKYQLADNERVVDQARTKLRTAREALKDLQSDYRLDVTEAMLSEAKQNVKHAMEGLVCAQEALAKAQQQSFVGGGFTLIAQIPAAVWSKELVDSFNNILQCSDGYAYIWECINDEALKLQTEERKKAGAAEEEVKAEPTEKDSGIEREAVLWRRIVDNLTAHAADERMRALKAYIKQRNKQRQGLGAMSRGLSDSAYNATLDKLTITDDDQLKELKRIFLLLEDNAIDFIERQLARGIPIEEWCKHANDVKKVYELCSIASYVVRKPAKKKLLKQMLLKVSDEDVRSLHHNKLAEAYLFLLGELDDRYLQLDIKYLIAEIDPRQYAAGGFFVNGIRNGRLVGKGQQLVSQLNFFVENIDLDPGTLLRKRVQLQRISDLLGDDVRFFFQSQVKARAPIDQWEMNAHKVVHTYRAYEIIWDLDDRYRDTFYDLKALLQRGLKDGLKLPEICAEQTYLVLLNKLDCKYLSMGLGPLTDALTPDMLKSFKVVTCLNTLIRGGRSPEEVIASVGGDEARLERIVGKSQGVLTLDGRHKLAALFKPEDLCKELRRSINWLSNKIGCEDTMTKLVAGLIEKGARVYDIKRLPELTAEMIAVACKAGDPAGELIRLLDDNRSQTRRRLDACDQPKGGWRMSLFNRRKDDSEEKRGAAREAYDKARKDCAILSGILMA